MMKQTIRNSNLAGWILALVLAGCTDGNGGVGPGDEGAEDPTVAETATVKGRISSQVSGATSIRTTTVSATGQEVFAEVAAGADGTYEIDAPANVRNLVAEAIDAAGQVVGSAIVELAGTAGEVVLVSPIDVETSLEASILIDIATVIGVPIADVNPIDLRARIDANLAAAVSATVDTDAVTLVLAQAVALAQQIEVESYARSGASAITQQVLFENELSAAASLNASLDAGVDATAQFITDLDAIAGSLGVDSRARLVAESAASLGFRGIIGAELDPSAVGNAAVLAAALRNAVLNQTAVMSRALEDVLSVAGLAQDVIDTALAATDTLTATVLQTLSVTDVVDAVAEFTSTIVGSLDVSLSASLLGDLLDLDVAVSAEVAAAIEATANLSSEIVDGLTELLEDLPGGLGGGLLDPDAIYTLTDGILDLVGDFELAVSTEVGADLNAAGLVDAQVAVSVDVLIMANLFVGI